MAAAASAQLDAASRRDVATTTGAPTSARPNLFARFIRAMQEARMRQAEQEVGRLIEARGWTLSDETERRVSNHFV